MRPKWTWLSVFLPPVGCLETNIILSTSEALHKSSFSYPLHLLLDSAAYLLFSNSHALTDDPSYEVVSEPENASSMHCYSQ